jgi:GNAT superfamily N-acetyltransferase
VSAAAPAAGAGLRVREVAPGEPLRPFVDLAWTVNAADPRWVPPLRMAVETVLDRRRHPFHRHAEAAYFLAERDGRPVGRIAAVVNRAHNDFHGEAQGTFGLFESADDPEAAAALLEAAAAWLRARGMTVMRGPFNLSSNDELYSPGVLVEGFDTPPSVMMSHNPPYYGRLLESAGLGKAKDLLAYWIADDHVPERLRNVMERMAARAGVSIRTLRLKELAAEVGRIQEVYNAAWSRNWGFAPMTEDEFRHLAKELRPVVDPELVLIAEKADGEPIGFLLALPDLNRALRHLPDGRLLPFGFLKFLWHRRRIDTVRILTLGLKPGYQHLGLGAALYARLLHVGPRLGYHAAEASWILEDNREMCLALEKLGARACKRYRVFEREI